MLREAHVIHFFSRSKPDDAPGTRGIPCDWKQYLSNFAPTYDHNHTYEHLFQSTKIRVSHGTTANKNRALLRLRNDPSPRQAKARGGRLGFARAGLVLNETVWSHTRDDVQHTILTHRVRTDALFCTILKWTAPRQLVYFERGTLTRPPYWGAFFANDAFVGENVLGKMLTEMRDDLLMTDD